MDRFAFFSAQPWLFPPPERSVPPRGELGAADGAVTVVVDGIPRRLPRHLALRPDLGGAPVDPPARGGVAHHPTNADPSVVFDGCASVHFSEREQYGCPPAGTPRPDERVSDEESHRECGHPSPREPPASTRPVVGAAAADAVHMAFAPHEEWPDQAQFACSIRVRRAVVEREPRGDRLVDEGRPRRDVPVDAGARVGRGASAEENDASDARACWLEMTVDGATHALDMSQSRHVVVGPPAERDRARVLDSPEPRPDFRPTESSRLEGRRRVRRKRRRGAVRGDDRRRKRRPGRRRDRDDFGNAGDDELESSTDDELATDVCDRERRGSIRCRRRRRYERPPSNESPTARDARDVHLRTDAAGSDPSDALDASAHDGFEDASTPYVTIVFAHVSLNLYHHPGVLGCRRSSPANERARVEKVRDALVAARSAAMVTRAETRVRGDRCATETERRGDGFGSIEVCSFGRDADATRTSTSFAKNLAFAANVTARACSTLPRLAARAACEAAVPDRAPTPDGPRCRAARLASAATRAALALEARRSCDLRWSLALIREREKGSGDETDDVPETARALLDDARAYAALARDA